MVSRKRISHGREHGARLPPKGNETERKEVKGERLTEEEKDRCLKGRKTKKKAERKKKERKRDEAEGTATQDRKRQTDFACDKL